MKDSCKNCVFWESEDRINGYCGTLTVFIEDVTAYRPAFATPHSFYCNLHKLYPDVHGAASDF